MSGPVYPAARRSVSIREIDRVMADHHQRAIDCETRMGYIWTVEDCSGNRKASAAQLANRRAWEAENP